MDHTNPLTLGADAQILPALSLLLIGALSMILIERYAPKNRYITLLRSWNDRLLLILKGMAMGMANKIPGFWRNHSPSSWLL